MWVYWIFCYVVITRSFLLNNEMMTSCFRDFISPLYYNKHAIIKRHPPPYKSVKHDFTIDSSSSRDVQNVYLQCGTILKNNDLKKKNDLFHLQRPDTRIFDACVRLICFVSLWLYGLWEATLLWLFRTSFQHRGCSFKKGQNSKSLVYGIKIIWIINMRARYIYQYPME